MTVSAPPWDAFTVLDQRIARALTALRLARATSTRTATPRDEAGAARAEANLNALLEYRYRAQQRAVTARGWRPAATAPAQDSSGRGDAVP